LRRGGASRPWAIRCRVRAAERGIVFMRWVRERGHVGRIRYQRTGLDARTRNAVAGFLKHADVRAHLSVAIQHTGARNDAGDTDEEGGHALPHGGPALHMHPWPRRHLSIFPYMQIA
jgi:hypothetical protein